MSQRKNWSTEPFMEHIEQLHIDTRVGPLGVRNSNLTAPQWQEPWCRLSSGLSVIRTQFDMTAIPVTEKLPLKAEKPPIS